MSDLIERQAAIKAVNDAFDRETLLTGFVRSIAVRAIRDMPSAQPEQRWIPVSEKLPEEDHWLGGSGKQFSDNVLVSVYNSDDEDEWVDVSQTIDGEWRIELPRHCKIVAWMPLPKPYKEGGVKSEGSEDA